MSDVNWVVDPITQIELVIPPFASSERAIKRAALERDGGLRHIRFYLEVVSVVVFGEFAGAGDRDC
jgi:hypothetical protein